ncbi:hypothetical protein Q5530_12535 [Saccharothrix sp. BKS2]
MVAAEPIGQVAGPAPPHSPSARPAPPSIKGGSLGSLGWTAKSYGQ